MPASGDRPSVARVAWTRSSGASRTSTVAPPWPRTSAAVAIARGHHGQERARPPSEQERAGQPEQEVRPEEHLEERHRQGQQRRRARASRAPRRAGARASAISEPRLRPSAGTTGFDSASETSRLPRSRSAHQWACGLAAKRNEKSVASSVQGARPPPAAGARQRVQHRAQEQHQRQRAQRDVEPRDLVVRVDAREAPGRGAHEVGPEVVAEREAGDARHLRRIPGGELVGEADVERGVRGDERVEQERAVGCRSGSRGTASTARSRTMAANGSHRAAPGRAVGAPPGRGPHPAATMAASRRHEEPRHAPRRRRASTRRRRTRNRVAAPGRRRRAGEARAATRAPGRTSASGANAT